MGHPSDLVEQDVKPGAAPAYRLRSEDVRRLVEGGAFDRKPGAELIGGVLLAAEPASPYHSGPLQTLLMRLARGVDPARWVVRVQQPFSVDEYSEPEPDLAVVPLEEAYRKDSHPRQAGLVVEVATTSLRLDTRTKLRLYAAAGVPEYWVVDTHRRCVLVHRDPEPGTGSYRFSAEAGPQESLSPAVVGGPPIKVSDLFA